MLLRTRGAELPVKLPVSFVDFDVINAGMSTRHQPVAIELPVLIAVGAVPLAGGGLGFIAVPNSNPVIGKRPEFFNEPVVQFARPFLLQKLHDLIASLQKRIPIAPPTIGRI